MHKDQICKNCRHWFSGEPAGECRLSPPQAHVIVLPGRSETMLIGGKAVNGGTGPQVGVQLTQPATPGDYWCGEFRTELDG